MSQQNIEIVRASIEVFATSARLNRRLTKVNRCMAEGRKAFLERFAEIYGGSA
jgi:hypothetical protein